MAFLVGPSCRAAILTACAVSLAQAALGQGSGYADGSNRPDPPVVRGFMSGGDLSDTALERIHDWGANVVRLQLKPGWLAHIWHVPDGAVWPMVVDSAAVWVERLGRHGLKAVVDLHNAPIPGVAGDSELTDAFWNLPNLTPAFCGAWTDLARRLLPLRSNIWAYDLFNEPIDQHDNPAPPRNWRPLAIAITHAIRAVDPNVWIVYEVGPGWWDGGFMGLVPLPDNRVIYSTHFYVPPEFTTQGIGKKTYGPADTVHYPGKVGNVYWDAAKMASYAAPIVSFQQRWHVPIFIGEFSVVRWAPTDEAVHWLSDAIALFESHGWSWAYHGFREWEGWSLEEPDGQWTSPAAAGPPRPASAPTARWRVVQPALARNAQESR